MLSDHAVLQRQMPVHIWGWAEAGEKVTVSFHGQTQTAVADDLGGWSVFLRPEQAGGPYVLTVQGSNTIRLEDILVGDVWFASGQSNMEFPLNGFPGNAVLKNGPQEIAAATQPQIRLLRFARKASEYELRDQDASWTLCTPETAAEFSAVAYFFARDLGEAGACADRADRFDVGWNAGGGVAEPGWIEQRCGIDAAVRGARGDGGEPE